MKFLVVLSFFLFSWLFPAPIKFIESSKQEAYAGHRQAGKSIHYLVKFIANKPSSKLSFDKIWIGSDQVEFKAYTLRKNNVISTIFEKGDTVIIDVYQHFRPDKEDNLIMVTNDFPKVPKEYKGQALIQYSYKGKIKYFIVKEFIEKEKVYYP